MPHRTLNKLPMILLFYLFFVVAIVACSDSSVSQNSQLDEQNVETYVQQQFNVTASAQSQFGATLTLEMAFNHALTATAIYAATETGEEREVQTATAEAQLYITSTRGPDGAFTLGYDTAPVTLIFFSDYACSHCIAYFPEIMRFIHAYVATGQAKLEYRQFPTSAGGQQSVFFSQIAECADQVSSGAFWKITELLYEIAGTAQYFQEDTARSIVEGLNLNYVDILECSRDAHQVNVDMDYARAFGLTGAPTVMVRYEDGTPEWIVYNGTTYNRGGVPFDVLTSIVAGIPQ